jgi:uncharacterized phage protein gp47/JayE
MLSLRQLLTPVTVEQVRATCLELLDSVGFQATAWESGDAPRTLVELFSTLVSDITYSIADIAAGGYPGLAAGPYADLLGEFFFNLKRIQPSRGVGLMVLHSDAAAPPHTFAANELTVSDADNDSARTYTVQTGGTLAPGATMIVTVIANAAGVDSNIAPNTPTLVLRIVPLLGVTVTNPPQPPTTPANTWLTAPGTDKETDGKGGRYNARMMGRWDRLAPLGNTKGAYRAWVLEALPAVTRIIVQNGTAPLAIRIVCATAVGGITSGQIATISDYLNGVTDGVGRRPMNDALEIVSANQLLSPPLGVAITVASPFAADAIQRVAAALQTLLGSLPIGGKRIGNATFGKVLISDLYKAVMSEQGILDVDFTITGDIQVGQDDIYQPIPSITMTIQAS